MNGETVRYFYRVQTSGIQSQTSRSLSTKNHITVFPENIVGSKKEPAYRAGVKYKKRTEGARKSTGELSYDRLRI